MSHLYIIGWTETPVKIGMTFSLGDRLAALQTACPFPLKVHHSFPVDRELLGLAEARAHDHFSSRRLEGEWFDITSVEAYFACKDLVEAIDLSSMRRAGYGIGFDITDEMQEALEEYRLLSSGAGSYPYRNQLHQYMKLKAGAVTVELFKRFHADCQFMMKPPFTDDVIWRKASDQLEKAFRVLVAFKFERKLRTSTSRRTQSMMRHYRTVMAMDQVPAKKADRRLY